MSRTPQPKAPAGQPPDDATNNPARPPAPKKSGDDAPGAPQAAPTSDGGSSHGLAELTKALGAMSERVERMARSLETIAERLAPAQRAKDANVEGTRQQVASLRSALLGSNQAAQLFAHWNGEALTAITLNGSAVESGFVIARQSHRESARAKVGSAGTTALTGLDKDEPIISLQLMETEEGPVVAYAGPIFKS